MFCVKRYDEEYFKILFDVINKFDIEMILIFLQLPLSNKDAENTCRKFVENIRILGTENIISNNVSCFYLYFRVYY